jgi:tetratricopeptide (TPR) repeat protein
MRRFRLALVCGLLLALASAGCNKLKARDQLNKGVAAFRNAQFQTAIDHFQQAVNLDPGLINARLYLAMSYLQQYVPGGDSKDNLAVAKQAIDAFQDVLNMDPSNATALASVAQIYYNMKDFEKAKEYQLRREQADPTNPESYYWIGVIDWAICYPRTMQLRKDLDIAAPRDASKPDVLPALPAKAREDLAKQNGPLVDEAMTSLQKAIDLKPNYEDAMAYLSLMYRQKAEIEADDSARTADLKAAEDWVQKAMNARKAAGQPQIGQ